MFISALSAGLQLSSSNFSRESFFRSVHSETRIEHRGIGVRAGGARGAAAPPKFGQLGFFLGSLRKFGQNQFLKTFPCFLNHHFEEINIFYFNLKLA